MENQGNMQSRKKAAVIYFLAAFFIACIGIAGANYLKGELGLSAEELVKKVELTVEIAVLLGIAIAVRHLLKKRNRKIAGIIVLLFVAGVFSWQNSGIWQESQLKPQRLETPESEFDRYVFYVICYITFFNLVFVLYFSNVFHKCFLQDMNHTRSLKQTNQEL